MFFSVSCIPRMTNCPSVLKLIVYFNYGATNLCTQRAGSMHLLDCHCLPVSCSLVIWSIIFTYFLVQFLNWSIFSCCWYKLTKSKRKDSGGGGGEVLPGFVIKSTLSAEVLQLESVFYSLPSFDWFKLAGAAKRSSIFSKKKFTYLMLSCSYIGFFCFCF